MILRSYVWIVTVPNKKRIIILLIPIHLRLSTLTAEESWAESIRDYFVLYYAWPICLAALWKWFYLICKILPHCFQILYGTNLFALSPVNKIGIDGGFIALKWWWNMLQPKGWIRLRELVWIKTLLAFLQFSSITSISWWAEIPSKSPISCKWRCSLFRWVETLKLDAIMPLLSWVRFRW